MATLQAYLLTHKKDPIQAVENAAGWAENVTNEIRVKPKIPKKVKAKKTAKPMFPGTCLR